MKTKGSITPLTALNAYGIMRLAARICELRDAGHNIKGVNVKVLNRFEKWVTVKKYFL